MAKKVLAPQPQLSFEIEDTVHCNDFGGSYLVSSFLTTKQIRSAKNIVTPFTILLEAKNVSYGEMRVGHAVIENRKSRLPVSRGFRDGASSVHTSRTMMLAELSLDPLTESATWKQIAQPQGHEILGARGIQQMPKIAVGTAEEVLDTLRHTKLSELRAISDALPTRFQNAAGDAAKLLEPKAQTVSLPGVTIKN